MSIKSVAIFCGSKWGANALFKEHAETLGRLLAQQNITLIYGGGKNGLMGAVADAAMANGGIVKGVIPQVLTQWEHQHTSITELEVVEDMHVRKRRLYELCDAAIILPGGFGTLDELFEVLTWNVLSIHDKPVVVLNSAGFYKHLLAHLQEVEAAGFFYNKLDEMLVVANTPEEAIAALLQPTTDH